MSFSLSGAFIAKVVDAQGGFCVVLPLTAPIGFSSFSDTCATKRRGVIISGSRTCLASLVTSMFGRISKDGREVLLTTEMDLSDILFSSWGSCSPLLVTSKTNVSSTSMGASILCSIFNTGKDILFVSEMEVSNMSFSLSGAFIAKVVDAQGGFCVVLPLTAPIGFSSFSDTCATKRRGVIISGSRTCLASLVTSMFGRISTAGREVILTTEIDLSDILFSSWGACSTEGVDAINKICFVLSLASTTGVSSFLEAFATKCRGVIFSQRHACPVSLLASMS